MSNLIGTAPDQVPVNGMLGKAAFLNQDVPVSGALKTIQTAPTIASATTIAPTALITFVSGTTSIATITPPTSLLTTGGQIILIPTGLWATTTAGNISVVMTATVGEAIILTYDATTTKWYPAISDTAANLSYTGTLTGSTGILNIGSGQVYKDASGNVGIGTSSPAQKLDILSTTTTVAKLTGGTGSNQGSYLNVQGNAIGNYSSIVGGAYNSDLIIVGSGGSNVWYQSPGAHIWNASGASEKMRIDSSGKVGINVVPVAGTNAKLQITGLATNATTLATAYSNASLVVVPKSTSGYSLAIASGTGDSPQLQVSANGAASGDLLIQPYGGNVGIGTASPVTSLTVQAGSGNGIKVYDASASGGGSTWPCIESIGSRSDGNGSFGGRFGAGSRRTDGTAIPTGWALGTYAFGGQWGTGTTYNQTNFLYSAAITGDSEGSFTSATAMPTALVFRTGSTGTSLQSINVTYGTERMRIDSSGNVTLQKNISVGAAAPTTSGAGITFPAAQSASSNANTLDDYEEGTWTPTTTGITWVGTNTSAYNYTKVGSVVTVVCLLGGAPSVSIANGATITLPFAQLGTANSVSAVITSAYTAEGTPCAIYNNLVHVQSAGSVTVQPTRNLAFSYLT
jgi:hypothetical protein